MKKILPILLCVAVIQVTAQDQSKADPELKNQLDSLNYFFGLTLGYSLETAPFETNSAIIAEGLIIAVEGQSKYDATHRGVDLD